MKKTLGFLMVLLSMNAFSFEIPGLLEKACEKGCTAEMKSIHDEFLKSPNEVTVYPALYSGRCHVLSTIVNPESNHFLTQLVDTDEKGIYTNGIGSRYTNGNDYASFSYEDYKSRTSYYPYNLGGKTRVTSDKTSTSFVNIKDWQIKNGTWLRQNLETKEILYISYSSDFKEGADYKGAPATTFCRLSINPNGQPTK